MEIKIVIRTEREGDERERMSTSLVSTDLELTDQSRASKGFTHTHTSEKLAAKGFVQHNVELLRDTEFCKNHC